VKGAVVVGLVIALGVGYALADQELERRGGLEAVSPMLSAFYGQPVAAVSSSYDIKGNVSYNTGERIYHVPGQRYYDDTVVSPSHGERWFCSEEEARRAGWRKSKI